MDYLYLCKLYEQLESTPKRLEKTEILSNFLERVKTNDLKHVIYLLQGKVFPIWDERKIGMSSQLMVKVISTSTGTSKDKIEKLWIKTGDLGKTAEQLTVNKSQQTLFSNKLSVEKVFNNIEKLSTLEGHGTVSRKVALISELLTSSSPLEAKFITRTVIEELRIGVAEGILRDSITAAYLPRVLNINTPKSIKPLKIKSIDELKKANLSKYKTIVTDDEKLAREAYNFLIDITQETYNITNDFSQVAELIKENKYKSKKVKVTPGIPINPMLAIKANDIQDAFKAVGKPLIAEFKLDGFRLQIHKKGKEYSFFTRRLENVNAQFKELIPILDKHIKAHSYIIDTETVGFDPKTKKYLPFQSISQRIRRKYHIEKTTKDIPVEINVFDILYKNEKSLMHKTQEERRKILEHTVKETKHEIVLTKKLVSDNESKLEDFYKLALEKGLEGIMLKNLNKIYTPGRRVAGWVKLKPTLEPLDLVIVKATTGKGKRAGWYSSFTLACLDDGKFLEIGKLGTGIKEKESESGISFDQLTKKLKPLIIKKKGDELILKPKIIVEVSYEEIQKSPNYNSGFALRFPRLKRERTMEKGPRQINTLKDIKHIYKKQK